MKDCEEDAVAVGGGEREAGGEAASLEHKQKIDPLSGEHAQLSQQRRVRQTSNPPPKSGESIFPRIK
eukprot:2345631-Rhodomonas_salina.1